MWREMGIIKQESYTGYLEKTYLKPSNMIGQSIFRIPTNGALTLLPRISMLKNLNSSTYVMSIDKTKMISTKENPVDLKMEDIKFYCTENMKYIQKISYSLNNHGIID